MVLFYLQKKVSTNSAYPMNIWSGYNSWVNAVRKKKKKLKSNKCKSILFF